LLVSSIISSQSNTGIGIGYSNGMLSFNEVLYCASGLAPLVQDLWLLSLHISSLENWSQWDTSHGAF